MGIPNGNKFDLFPGVLRPRDVVGRVVEDPRRESQELGGALTLLQLLRQSPRGWAATRGVRPASQLLPLWPLAAGLATHQMAPPEAGTWGWGGEG